MFDFWKKLDHQARFSIVVSYSFFFTMGTWNALQGSILPELADLCGYGETTSGLMISAQSLGSLIGSLCIGLISIKLGNRRSAIVLTAVGVLFTLCLFLFRSAAGILFAFLMIGLSRGSISGTAAFSVNHISNGDAGASNVVITGFALGAILMPMIILLCNRFASWSCSIFIAALFGIIAILLCLRTKDDDQTLSSKSQADHSLDFLKNKTFFILSVTIFFYMCAEYAISGWLVTYIQNKTELIQLFSEEAELNAYSQTISTLLWFVILAGRLLCGYLNSKMNTRLLMFISSIGMAIFFTMLIFSNTLIGVTISVAVLGFCMAGMYPNLVAQSAPFMEEYAMASGVYHAIGSSGAILMPAIVGIIADSAGFTGGMLTVLAAMILLIISTAILFYNRSRTSGRF